MAPTLSIKDNQVVYTTPDGVETAALAMQTRSGTTYALRNDGPAPQLQPNFIQKLGSGSVAVHGKVFGHSDFPDGEGISPSAVAKLSFPGFVLEGDALKTTNVISLTAVAQAEPVPPQAQGGRIVPPAGPGGVQ